jgi:hypothetical protein
MADNMRTCRKTACRWPAAASLSYRYDSRQVWLLDLSEEADPSLYDLCPPHADALVVPRGWERVDQRTHTEPVVEPAGRDLVGAPGREPIGPGGYGGNRYEVLRAELPRLAEELAAETAQNGRNAEHGRPQEDTELADAPAEAGRDVPRHPAVPRHTVAPRPSRELAPVAVDDPPAPRTSAPQARAGTSGTAAGDDACVRQQAEEDQVPGQLAIPVDDEDTEVGEAVVVSIEAGRRRSAVSR